MGEHSFLDPLIGPSNFGTCDHKHAVAVFHAVQCVIISPWMKETVIFIAHIRMEQYVFGISKLEDENKKSKEYTCFQRRVCVLESAEYRSPLIKKNKIPFLMETHLCSLLVETTLFVYLILSSLSFTPYHTKTTKHRIILFPPT